ncbi:hypothetical protein FRIGORI9N_390040 [Frigoribacterium sp. 9N]|nr:hypothetical protein FRIGORI9N_390040 [Frigoribacterium sp. 9N]
MSRPRPDTTGPLRRARLITKE